MSGLALPGEPCGTEPLPSWTPQEKWVWERVCRGERADFNAAEDYGGRLDPKRPEGWPEGRVLRPAFLETVLLHEPYRSALPRQGVRISGARFIDTLDLSNATLAHQLWLDYCRFEASVTLARVQALSLISLEGSTFTGPLDMNGLQVEGSLFMREKAQFADVELVGAKVGGQLDMSGSTFTGKLNMNGLQVEGDRFMRNAHVTTESEVYLIFAKIAGNLDISGSEIPSLDLTGTQVREDFRLGSERHPPVGWREGARLTLRNTAVGALQDRPEPEAWPADLELEGFTYTRLGGLAAGSSTEVTARNASWFKGWLARQKAYSPQPYERLASVLVEAGYKDKARDILYESKERERRERTQGRALLWLWVLKLSIGYGYRSISRVFLWIHVFTFIGAVVLQATCQGPAKGLEAYGLFYSLDMFIPIIKLREFHYKIDLDGIARVYFYFHKLIGYFLASLLVAGLTGLTKK